MENNEKPQIENNAEKPKKKYNLRTIVLATLFSVLPTVGLHECSGKEFFDKVPNNKVVEEKEGSNSVAFSCVFYFYRGGGTNPGFYDFNGGISKKNGIYECTIKLKGENDFSYELISKITAEDKTKLEKDILNIIVKSLPEPASKEDLNRAKEVVKNAVEKAE